MPSALDKIIEWASELPDWQSDIVHRLLIKETLSEDDYRDALAMLKACHDLEDSERKAPKPRPLTAGAVSGSIPSTSRTVLRKLTVLSSVNAIPDGSSLEFGHEGITAVYGHNASGKSGFARVLKRACNSRDSEEKIYPNVYLDEPHAPASAKIHLTIDEDTDEEFNWSDESESPEILSSISVFDAKCARVIVDDNNTVVYLPYGTHVFNDLGTVLTKLRSILEQERPSPEKPQLTNVPEETAAGKFLAALNKDTTAKVIDSTVTWTEDDEHEFKSLQRSVIEAQSKDPMKVAQQLQSTAESLDKFNKRIADIEDNLGNDVEEKLIKAAADHSSAKQALEVAGRDSFSSEPLDGVGTPIWRSLYDAAREYSVHHAYPGAEFPHTYENSRCVLCQQLLDNDAKQRFNRFKTYMEEPAKKAEEKAALALKNYTDKIEGLVFPLPETAEPLLIPIRTTDAKLADDITAFLKTMEDRKLDLLKYVHDNTTSIRLPATESPRTALKQLIDDTNQQAGEIEKTAQPDELDKLIKKQAEMEARKNLTARKADLKEFTKQAGIATRYDACIQETDTRSISLQGKKIISDSLTPQLGSHLDAELQNMKAGHIHLGLKPTSTRGETMHQLKLEGSHTSENVRLSEILSEGEHCVVAIAGFLAELDISGHKCPIVFDDPVCSLDHRYRQWIAERIVRESTKRQVIVFTHDIAFLLHLQEEAGRLDDTPFLALTVRHSGGSPGYCESGLPWHAMRVKDRIGNLRVRLDEFKGLYPNNKPEYNERAGVLYGRLRETWEAAVEEKVLNEAIRRHGCEVQTMRLRGVEFTTEIYKDIHEGMDKCSTWMIGHDKSKDLSEDRPPPEDLHDDIEALHTFIKKIDRNREDLRRERESAVVASAPEEIG